MRSPRLVARLLAGLLVVALMSLGGTTSASATVPHSLRDLLGLLSGTTVVSPDLVVKVDLADGHTISELTSRYGLQVTSPLLASRGIYLVKATRPSDLLSGSTLNALVGTLKRDPAVVYVETNVATVLNDTRMHGWPEGAPVPKTSDAAAFLAQPAATGLAQVHLADRGAGEKIAVLDTGVDADHPALAGHLANGWDYVDDDDDPTDVPADPSGSPLYRAYGHGTFVAGLITLVAPDATIMPERVLDGDGNGNVFVIAQAILDAVDEGADVINLSFGTEGNVSSHLLDDALTQARSKGVLVVVSAGNRNSLSKLYPASSPSVLSVTALDSAGAKVADYASWGWTWVDVAAPGTAVLGPVPGGGYAVWSGTSMAAPMVSGQVALVRARSPRLSLDQQTDAVEDTARSLPPFTKLVQHGAVNIPASLRTTSSLFQWR